MNIKNFPLKMEDRFTLYIRKCSIFKNESDPSKYIPCNLFVIQSYPNEPLQGRITVDGIIYDNIHLDNLVWKQEPIGPRPKKNLSTLGNWKKLKHYEAYTTSLRVNVHTDDGPYPGTLVLTVDYYGNDYLLNVVFLDNGSIITCTNKSLTTIDVMTVPTRDQIKPYSKG